MHNMIYSMCKSIYDSLNTPLETQIGCNDLDQKNESHKLQGEFDYE